jgi:hypothetical protein
MIPRKGVKGGVLWVTRGADSHRLATHSNQANPTAGGPRQSLTRKIRLTPLSQEVPSAPAQNSLGVEPTHLLGVLQRLPAQRNHAHPTSVC